MAGEIHHHTEQVPLHIPHAHRADLRINRPGVTENLGIARAGMREGQPALHAQSTIERDLVLVAEADGELRVDAGVVRLHDRFDNLLLEQRGVARIRNDGLVVHQLFHQRRGLIEIARFAHADRPRRMRM